MSQPLTIIVADYVPLANKGEEAIIRGIEDLLGADRHTEIGVFGDGETIEQHGSITVFPWHWIFRAQGNHHHLRGHARLIHDIWMVLQMRCGWWGRIRNLTNMHGTEKQKLVDFFQAADLILVGHDGVFCTESCAVIHWAKKQGKRVGVLGASAVLPAKLIPIKGWLYRQALDESDFCFFREHFAQNHLMQVAREPEMCQLAPDPAFAMRPASVLEVQKVLKDIPAYQQARQGGRPIIAVTVVEKGRVFTGFRPDLQGEAKRDAHAKYLSEVLLNLQRESNAFLLFLPHAMESDASDVQASQRVFEVMKTGPDNAVLIDRELDARILKGLIRECDFLVGERTHSLIGAVSVGTPFVGLTNEQDTRTHGILGDMCACAEQLINIASISADQTSKCIIGQWQQREVLTKHLLGIQPKLTERLLEMKDIVLPQ